MATKNAEYVLTPELLGLSKPQRAAHFLDWQAKHHPGTWVAYNDLLRSIMGYKKKPLLKSEEVEHLRRSGQSIKRTLWEKYNREIVSLPGVGIRAASDDADVLTNVVPKRASRLQTARKNFVQTVTNIDQKKIPDTAALKPYKAWLNKEIKDLVRQLDSPEFERKLLPPVADVVVMQPQLPDSLEE